jgi:hypothetical protein
MIGRVLSLNYTPDRDAMALYRIIDSTNAVTTQIETESQSTLRHFLGLLPHTVKRQKVLFQIIEGTNEKIFANSTRYSIHFSRDGVHVEIDTKVLCLKKSSCLEIFLRLGIECDLSNLRYALTYNHRIDQLVSEAFQETTSYNILRVDIVPENQRHEGDYIYLLRVAFGYLGNGSNATMPKGYPFFFPVLEGEVFGDTKQRLMTAIGWESGEGVAYRFMLDKLAPESEIADDVVLSHLGTERSTLVVIGKDDSKPITPASKRASSQGVRIYN